MNFSSIWLRSFRVLLFPFALVYGLIIIIRNYLYDKNIIRAVEFNFPVLCVGNLSVGGTGKSPMVEYLLRLLTYQFQVATLSRGYKRKTRGYVLANDQTTAIDIGDEPMQFHIKFPEVAVAVGEERSVVIPQLLYDCDDIDVIILDDAFQHRAIKPGFNILLTDYNNLFTRDFFLPSGDLRDARSSYKRADIIIITKCAQDLPLQEKKSLTAEIDLLPHQQLFFTGIHYGAPYHIISHAIKHLNRNSEVLLVCGIANPEPLNNYLQHTTKTYEAIYFNDHHIFRIDDLNEIRRRFDRIKASDKIIITTEKDAVRLIKFAGHLKDIPIYVLPIETNFLFNEAARFNDLIVTFIKDFANKNQSN
ncbi:MAG: tetraacyldisaccharide 4'-kinase [Bacteroidetes bacterium]|nr:MAG: tetraacyldisaccharide 4'-kinase [Bacteroidota bacterium]